MKGTHNSLTGEGAWRWWMRMWWPVWRCQSKTLEEQINAGVRLFDIRVRWDGHEWRGAHGACMLRSTLMDAVCLILWGAMSGRIQGRPTVWLIIEKGDEQEREWFRELCRRLEMEYPDIQFVCGRYKPTWQQLYHFDGDVIDGQIKQPVGSMDPRGGWRRLVGRISPWLWHRWLRKGLPAVEDGEIALVDFL